MERELRAFHPELHPQGQPPQRVQPLPLLREMRPAPSGGLSHLWRRMVLDDGRHVQRVQGRHECHRPLHLRRQPREGYPRGCQPKLDAAGIYQQQLKQGGHKQ